MKITKEKNKIIVYEPTDFNVNQTLDCGQIFRYKINGDIATVCSMDKCAILHTYADRIEIETNDTDYFYHFFDFDRDYSLIKNELKKDEFLSKAVDYGYGIRIINNDALEMIISFIISANNNIPRIKKSIEYICTHFGDNKGEYFAFPTLDQLKTISVEDFTKAGLGYRAEQMHWTIEHLTYEDIDRLKTLDGNEKFNYLISLKGIGEKVANCVLLFGLGEKSVFPVDTWINKVYNRLTNTTTSDRKKITKELTTRYGELSGFAQQYFFYYFRDNDIK